MNECPVLHEPPLFRVRGAAEPVDFETVATIMAAEPLEIAMSARLEAAKVVGERERRARGRLILDPREARLEAEARHSPPPCFVRLAGHSEPVDLHTYMVVPAERVRPCIRPNPLRPGRAVTAVACGVRRSRGCSRPRARRSSRAAPSGSDGPSSNDPDPSTRSSAFEVRR